MQKKDIIHNASYRWIEEEEEEEEDLLKYMLQRIKQGAAPLFV